MKLNTNKYCFYTAFAIKWLYRKLKSSENSNLIDEIALLVKYNDFNFKLNKP